MNCDIAMGDIVYAVKKAKSGKAVGVDEVLVEVLKSETVLRFLQKLFELCFRHGSVPGIWNKWITHPIP